MVLGLRLRSSSSRRVLCHSVAWRSQEATWGERRAKKRTGGLLRGETVTYYWLGGQTNYTPPPNHPHLLII